MRLLHLAAAIVVLAFATQLILTIVDATFR